jgi:DNA-binding FadR family transcriptional regulator
MAEIVAAQLRGRIVSGDLADGDELPRESDMLETTGVSRPTLREALRILETEGLVRIRRGKVGGAVVSHPTVESAAYHLGLTLQSNGVSLFDLASARLAIQPSCASLAAGAPHREEIAVELTDLVEESQELVGTGEEFTVCAQRFHARLTELCGNTTMLLIAGTLEAVWGYQERRPKPEEVNSTLPELMKVQRRTITDHRRIVGHITRGEGDGAARVMRRHLAEMHDPTLHVYGDASVEIVTAAGMPSLRPA